MFLQSLARKRTWSVKFATYTLMPEVSGLRNSHFGLNVASGAAVSAQSVLNTAEKNLSHVNCT